MDKTEAPDDRREFFRLDDEIPLEVEVLNSADSPVHSLLQANPGVKLRSQFYYIDEQYYPYLSQIIRTNPYVAEYFNSINQKLDLIIQSVLQVDPMAARWVNISAGGLAFRHADSLSPGTFVQFSFVLPTSQAFISARAEVVFCQSQSINNQEVYRISTRFVDLNERHEAAITRHVFQRELEAKRRSRMEDE